MKTKLEMAHEYAKIIIEKMLSGDIDNLKPNEIASDAFDWVEAMQAEEHKRKSATILPALQQTFVNGVEQPRYAPCFEEWQPDWTQAPEWANWWAMDSDKRAYYFKSKPYLGSSIWLMRNVCEYDSSLAPAHDYQGNWKDSLRERPE